MQCEEMNPDLKTIFVFIKKPKKHPYFFPQLFKIYNGTIASVLLLLALNVSINATSFGKWIMLSNTEAFPLILQSDGHISKNTRLSWKCLLYKHSWKYYTSGKPKTALLPVGRFSTRMNQCNDIGVSCTSWY